MLNPRTIKNKIVDCYVDNDKGHGHVAQRPCYVTDKMERLDQKSEWRDLKTIAMVESIITTANKTTKEQRFFISSLSADAKEIADAIRSHWAIEDETKKNQIISYHSRALRSPTT